MKSPCADTLRKCADDFLALFDATPPAGPVEWCERHLFVPDPARGGMRHWQGALYPHHNEILRDWVADDVREIVLCGAAQSVGKTVIATACALYSAHVERVSVLMMLPIVSLAEEVGGERIQSAINASSELAAWFYPAQSRNAKNTKLVKSFPGGKIELVGSNSPASLRARSAARLIADDIDACVATAEGDPLDLFRKRSAGVQDGDTKLLLISSPAHIATSKIWPAYQASSKAVRRHPCPHCRADITLEGDELKPFRALRWTPGEPHTATFFCTACEAAISETERLACFFASRWRHEKPEEKRRGYRMGAAYLPWTKRGTLGQAHAIVSEWEAAGDDHEKRRVVINTVLALPFTEVRVEFTWEALAKTREAADWRNARHPDCGLVTCGIDVQDDRLIGLILGHDTNSARQWVIDYVVIMGSPRMPEHARDCSGVWLEMDARRRQYSPIVTLVDHGGHCAREVALYCGPRMAQGVYASKGSSQHGAPTVKMGKSKPIGNAAELRLYMLGTTGIKDSIEARITAGRLHFPEWLPDAFFQELCSESPGTEVRHGRQVRMWQLKPGERNNHALDVVVYATAAAAVAMASGKVRRYQLETPAQAAPEPPPEHEKAAQPVARRAAGVLRNSFVR